MQKGKSNRGRKIIWFNPPYSCNVANNIDKKVFLLLDKHFPKAHKFYKIFNRNNVRVSYSSMADISSIIKSHNKKFLSNDKLKSSKYSCNFRDKSSCPLNGNCLQQNVIYYNKIIPRDEFTNKNHPHYIGLIEGSSKDSPGSRNCMLCLT